MRWSMLAAVGVLAGCAKATTPDAVAPLVVAPVPRQVEDAKLSLATSAYVPTWPTRSGDTSWVRTLPKAKELARVDGFARAPQIGITWRVGTTRRKAGTEDETEGYPSLYESDVTLVLTNAASGEAKEIDLGYQSGSMEGGAVSVCERAGYRHPDVDHTFAYADLPNRVAFWEIDTMQGGTEFLVLLGADRMHVLRRYTNDGMCGEMQKQGPLEVCEGQTWNQLLEIPVTGEPRVSERSVDRDESGTDTPSDCKASYSGQDLLAPG